MLIIIQINENIDKLKKKKSGTSSCLHFKIGVECTSKVSSWSFRPPPPPRPTPKLLADPNDSSPVSTGRINKRSVLFFFFRFFPQFLPLSPFCSLQYFFVIFFLISVSQRGSGSTRNRPTGEGSPDGMGGCG